MTVLRCPASKFNLEKIKNLVVIIKSLKTIQFTIAGNMATEILRFDAKLTKLI